MDNQLQLEFRQANINDNLEEISELIYYTDQYIYPYWFGDLENCINELPKLLIEENFFFNINNLFITKDITNNKIIGVICVVDKNTNLDYDYEKLEKINDRYNFTINNYIKTLINEVQESDFAYISNVCVHPDYRGKKIGNHMVKKVIEIYRQKAFTEISLDVIADNSNAIHLYEKLGFSKSSEIFDGFNGPNQEKPDVFSMKNDLSDD